VRADGSVAGKSRETPRTDRNRSAPRAEGRAVAKPGEASRPERSRAAPRARAEATSAIKRRDAARGAGPRTRDDGSAAVKPRETGRPERSRAAPRTRADGSAAVKPRETARPERKRPDARVRADGSVAGEVRETHRTGEPQRLAKLLARAGIASRREIERMIEERRIAIDGKPVETPATVLTSLKGVTVDGKPVRPAADTRLFLFHKPPGVLTAERDFSGRPTIYDKLPPDLPRLMPVGRLDLNTEGLLLLTNDGEFKRQLELPATGVERTYRARVYGEVHQDQLDALIEGVEIEGVRYGSIDANMERRTGSNFWVEMRLKEGKNREVRNVLEYLGLQVSRLIRIAYGPFVLGAAPASAVEEVRQHELVEFRKGLKASC
jgi:23S rRNA pseudouridine2605 synthase